MHRAGDFRSLVPVIERNEVKLATEDAALGIGYEERSLEAKLHILAELSIGTREDRAHAERDLGRADARLGRPLGDRCCGRLHGRGPICGGRTGAECQHAGHQGEHQRRGASAEAKG